MAVVANLHRLFATQPFAAKAFPRRWRRYARPLGIGIAGAAILSMTVVSDPRNGLGRTLMAGGMANLAAALLTDEDWRAAALYEAGRYPDAITIFRAQGRRGAYNLGNALARSGDLEGALGAYDEALAYNPRDADAQANRSLVAQLLADDTDRGKGKGIANASAQYGARFGTTQNQDKAEDIEATSSGEGLAGNKEAGSSESLPGTSPVARRGRSEQQSVDAGKGQARGSASDAAGRGRQGAGSAMVAAAPEREARRVTKSFEAHEIHADRLWLQTLPDEPGRFLKLRLKAEQARRIEAGTAMPGGNNPW